ncbi:MAG: 50S ribosomal protein L4 [Clostridia bacterium]|nr:50S ribosomal protein L4 [Clostridia bacterium]
MAKLNVYNMKHEQVGEVEVRDEIFGAEYNEPLIHQVIVAIQNNGRQGTKSTLTRSEVRGHAKKPWRQKGTGRARQGSTKGPQWVGGGVVFAPKPRDFSQKVNKKMRDLALISALSEKLKQNEIVVVDKLDINAPKTKTVVDMLNAFGIKNSTVIVTAENNDIVLKSVNNLENIDLTTSSQLNVYDVVANGNVLFTKDALIKLEEAYN